MSRPVIENRTYDELVIGDRVAIRHTVSQNDVELFAHLSGDVNPAHLDEAYAASTRFGKRIAHGMLSGGLISTVLGTRLPGPGTIHLGQSLRFTAPVMIGDTVVVTLTVKEKRERRVVLFDCTVAKTDGTVVVTGEAEVMAPKDKVRREPVELPQVILRRSHGVHEGFVARAQAGSRIPTAVAHPCDETSLRGALEARDAGIIEPVLVGPVEKIETLAHRLGLDLAGCRLVEAPHSHAAAARAVELARRGAVQLLMKGSLHSDELLHEVTARETGLRTGRRISHVFLMDVPSYPKPLFVTDAAVNIVPDLETKADIVQNAIDLFRGLGLGTPKVAILSAVETVTPKIPTTLEAAALCKMAERGQITGGLLDGPLALDNAISLEAARIKHIEGPVAGQADILLVPDLEAGNMLAKNLSFLAGAEAAGIVLGAAVPIVLTSRADTVRTRLASAAVAALYAAVIAAEPGAAPATLKAA
ncbi:bifunctional enoyl-CoA hydratase/phosphate acetyltransferase [Benzoatithermus flavus]|uniref:Bifunctional enoyl-CoA hydratase/phosphate acetyltransferase n=1 Tax=Benzoatithermus flavus TaxID=3108223 RepID=A0ABU8XPT6_9PROT